MFIHSFFFIVLCDRVALHVFADLLLFFVSSKFLCLHVSLAFLVCLGGVGRVCR